MRVDLKGVHRVKRKLASGRIVEIHYAWRGGPCFWRSDSGIPKGGPAYVKAFADASPRGRAATGKVRSLILRWLASPEFKGLAERTQSDFLKSIRHPTHGIDAVFGDAPLAVLEDKRIRRRVLDWRDRIGGKVGDDHVRHLQRIVGYGLDRGDIEVNRLTGIKSVYRSNRADVFWTEAEIAAFVAGAPEHVWRILVAATETGLRPGDLRTLAREHVHPTPKGRRIVVWTAKRKRPASIPVTPRMAELIDSTPEGETIFLRGQRGRPYTHENYLGDAVSEWRDRINAAARKAVRPEPIRAGLRLYDARGTAATRLFNAGAKLKEIATAMGWSIKHAGQVIERYVALHPDMTDELGDKLAAARENEPSTKPVNGAVNGGSGD